MGLLQPVTPTDRVLSAPQVSSVCAEPQHQGQGQGQGQGQSEGAGESEGPGQTGTTSAADMLFTDFVPPADTGLKRSHDGLRRGDESSWSTLWTSDFPNSSASRPSADSNMTLPPSVPLVPRQTSLPNYLPPALSHVVDQRNRASLPHALVVAGPGPGSASDASAAAAAARTVLPRSLMGSVEPLPSSAETATERSAPSFYFATAPFSGDLSLPSSVGQSPTSRGPDDGAPPHWSRAGGASDPVHRQNEGLELGLGLGLVGAVGAAGEAPEGPQDQRVSLPSPQGKAPASEAPQGASICTYTHPLSGAYCGTHFNRYYDLSRHRQIHAKEELRAIQRGEILPDQAVVWGKEVDRASASFGVEWQCDCGSFFSRKDALLRHKRLRDH